MNISSASYTGSILSVQLNTGATRLLAGGGESAPSIPGNTAIGADIDPLGLAVDLAGNVDFTAGSDPSVVGASTIMQLPLNGTSLMTIAGTGHVGSTGDGGPATAAEILSALSMTLTASGDVLFTEPSRVRSINTVGKITTFAGTGADNYFGDGGPAAMAGISSAGDTIADTKGNLYIADSGNGVVRRIDGLTGAITTIAGNGGFASYQPGNTSTTSLPGDGGLATETPLGSPRGLALGTGNNLYIGDYYQGIRVVDLSTGVITTLNSQQQVGLTIAFDNKHTLYTTNGLYIDAVDTGSGTSSVIAGNGSNSFTGGSLGDGGPATDAFIYPNGVALDNAGNLYIADGLANGIRVVNLSTGVINVYAGGYPDGVFTGQNFGYSGDGGPASAATFRDIAGLHSDGMGNLLLADFGNNAIREINLSSTIINTVAGDGSAGYSGDSASATAAMLNSPLAASADTLGNLYIAADNRIRRVVSPLSASPYITALSPNYGAPAALIEITGSNFGTTPGSVTVGGAPSRVVSWSNTNIVIQVPSRAATGNIVVTTSGAASNGAAFTFYPYPAITGISPASGPVGTRVTITGTGLLDGGGNGVVTFNGTPATILSETGTSIQVNVPFWRGHWAYQCPR